MNAEARMEGRSSIADGWDAGDEMAMLLLE